jgi:hypothetical protein
MRAGGTARSGSPEGLRADGAAPPSRKRNRPAEGEAQGCFTVARTGKRRGLLRRGTAPESRGFGSGFRRRGSGFASIPAERQGLRACLEALSGGGRSPASSASAGEGAGPPAPEPGNPVRGLAALDREEPAGASRPGWNRKPAMHRAFAPRGAGRDHGQASKPGARLRRESSRPSGSGTFPAGNGTRLASAATRPTQREPPRDPAAAVAGTVGAGGDAGSPLIPAFDSGSPRPFPRPPDRYRRRLIAARNVR